MKFSEQWLREWANPKVSTAELVEQLTMSGLEVDATQAAAPPFSGVVIGQILSVSAHPNADKLNICQVQGHAAEPVQVVCGAPNVAVGIKVPFATLGAILPSNFKIKKAKLRGMESFGMLCSASELGIGDDDDGLAQFPDDAPVGSDLFAYLKLDDTIIDVDLTPNRGDCLSIRGLAREISAFHQVPVQEPTIETINAQNDHQFPIVIDVPQACPCYLGRVIRQVRADVATPLWLSERLRRSGIRSVHAIVDILNYVMLELGQPMHGFDLDTLKGRIRVCTAQGHEQLTLLDGQTVQPAPDTLLIADDEKILGLAGIMGGQTSGICRNTRHILLESAFFTPESIAGRARKLGLHTDASHRFERGVDPELSRLAIERATALILEICGGETGPVIEQSFPEHRPVCNTLLLRRDYLKKTLGMSIADDTVHASLSALGFQAVEHAQGWQVVVPSWRSDVAIEIDLVEEVGRLYGYNRLPKTPYFAPILPQPYSQQDSLLEVMNRTLVGQGYAEAINYSFIDPKLQAQFSPETSGMPLMNPISSEMSVMRTSLLPGLVRNALYNSHRQQQRLRFFESGQVFIGQPDNMEQRLHMAAVLGGPRMPTNWANSTDDADFFDIKGHLEQLLHSSQCRDYRFVPAEQSAMHPGQCAAIYQRDVLIGHVGALHPQLKKTLAFDKSLYLFELNLSALTTASHREFVPLSRYPQVQRDMAVIVDQAVLAADVMAAVYQAGGNLLHDVTLFDRYQGNALDSHEQSLALRLTFQHAERTLQDSEIVQAMDRAIEQLHTRFKARLRE